MMKTSETQPQNISNENINESIAKEDSIRG
jgi:hypothetical protein